MLSLASQNFRLTSHELTVDLNNFGARILALGMRNEDGSTTNVALGFKDLESYRLLDSRIGAICGRYANRIKHGRCQLNDEAVQLDINNGLHHLHGGSSGFDSRLWEAERLDANTVKFSLTTLDGDQGYPGELACTATYRLIGNKLECRLWAGSTKDTLINLTNHAYWNLSGRFNSSVADHHLLINAESYLPVDEELIPLGPELPVYETEFDFTQLRTIADPQFLSRPEQRFNNELVNRSSPLPVYDHNFCLNGPRGLLRHVATLHDTESFRTMHISTTEAGLQFYLASHFTPEMRTADGQAFHPSCALALEPQTYPDSPNRERYPSPILKAGKNYEHIIEYRFETKKYV